MQVDWAVIQDFPNYVINVNGEVLNSSTGREIRPRRNPQGDVIIGLMSDKQYTRSVRVLVARAFVPGESDIYDTAMQLDGDPDNLNADNIVWRPRWFACMYSRQFRKISEIDRIGPIRDVETGDRYTDVYEAAITNGLLFKDIRKSMVTGESVFPTFQRFAVF